MNKEFSRHARDKWYAPEWAWWRQLPNDARALYDFLCDSREAAQTLTGIFQPPLVLAAQLVTDVADPAQADRYVRRLLRALEIEGAIAQQRPYLWIVDLTRIEGVSGSALASAWDESELLLPHCPALVAGWRARHCPEGRAAIRCGGRPRKETASDYYDAANGPLHGSPGFVDKLKDSFKADGKPPVSTGDVIESYPEKPPVSEYVAPEKTIGLRPFYVEETGGYLHDNNAQLEEPGDVSLRSTSPGAQPADAASPPPGASLLGDATLPPATVTPELVELAQAMIDGLGGPKMTLPPKHGAKPLAKGMATAAASLPNATAVRFKLAWLWGQSRTRSPWPTRMLEGVKWLKGALFVTLLTEWEADGAPAMIQLQPGDLDRLIPTAAPAVMRPAMDRDELGGRL